MFYTFTYHLKTRIIKINKAMKTSTSKSAPVYKKLTTLSAENRFEFETKRSDGSRPSQRRDCTVVAIAYCCGVDYKTAFDWCAKNGRRSSSGFDIATVLKMHITFDRTVLGKRVSMVKFEGFKYTEYFAAKEFNSGSFMLMVPQHVAALIDGKIYDHTNEPNELVDSMFKFE